MNYPVILQRDASECGPACLATIAAAHGRHVSIASLRVLARTGRHGTSLAGLIRASRQMGFEARAVRAGTEALAGIPLPAIAHWEDNGRGHFVVVHEVTRETIVIGDPAAGLLHVPRALFVKRWTGVVMLLTPAEPAPSGGEHHAAEPQGSRRSSKDSENEPGL